MLRSNVEVCDRLSDLGVVSDAFLSANNHTIKDNMSSNLPNGNNPEQSSSNIVEEIPVAEGKPAKSPISEILSYSRWIDQLRMKWPINLGSGS